MLFLMKTTISHSNIVVIATVLRELIHLQQVHIRCGWWLNRECFFYSHPRLLAVIMLLHKMHYHSNYDCSLRLLIVIKNIWIFVVVIVFQQVRSKEDAIIIPWLHHLHNWSYTLPATSIIIIVIIIIIHLLITKIMITTTAQ